MVVWCEKFEHKHKDGAIASNWEKGKLKCWFPCTFILFVVAAAVCSSCGMTLYSIYFS